MTVGIAAGEGVVGRRPHRQAVGAAEGDGIHEVRSRVAKPILGSDPEALSHSGSRLGGETADHQVARAAGLTVMPDCVPKMLPVTVSLADSD